MNALELSRLQLERHFFSQIQIEALPERERGAKVSLEADVVEGQRTDGNRQFRVVLGVVFGPAKKSKPGYQGKVKVVGYFKVSDGCSYKEAVDLVADEGSFLLFDAIRELVCNLTARGPWPMLRLPHIVFRDAPESESASVSKKTPRRDPRPRPTKKNQSRPHAD